MGIRDLIEAMRAEALNRLREERRKRKEQFKVRLVLPEKEKNRRERLERENRLL